MKMSTVQTKAIIVWVMNTNGAYIEYVVPYGRRTGHTKAEAREAAGSCMGALFPVEGQYPSMWTGTITLELPAVKLKRIKVTP